MKIRTEQNIEPKRKPMTDKLGFGQHFTDHMFLMDYTTSQGWIDPRIVPYAAISMDPAAKVFHYGQSVFEGLKCFKGKFGSLQLFRPERNIQRLNRSLERMSMPVIDEAFLLQAIKSLVRLDAAWVPEKVGSSLYIRPFVIATEASLGIRGSNEYTLIIILTPADSYFGEGVKPIKLLAELNYTRSVQGGTGFAKTAGNYAAGLKVQTLAEEYDCAQVLWLDALEKRYIEEAGNMNVFFQIDNEIVTPELNDSILAGVTRDSVIQLLHSRGYTVKERRVSLDECIHACSNGRLREAFGTGTGAVIAPISGFVYNAQSYEIKREEAGSLATKLYDHLIGIQNGRLPDHFKWMDCC